MKLELLILVSTITAGVISFDLGNGGIFNQSPEQRSYWAQRFGSGFFSALSRHQVQQRNQRHISKNAWKYPLASSSSEPRPQQPQIAYGEDDNEEKEQERYFHLRADEQDSSPKVLRVQLPAHILTLPITKYETNTTSEEEGEVEKNYDLKIVQYVYLNKKSNETEGSS